MKYLSLVLLFFICCSCKKAEVESPTTFDVTKSYVLKDISYGDHNQQKMDIYLPPNRSADSTKVIVLIHGGGWSEGDKSGLENYFINLKKALPYYAIININYRLGTSSDPGYPKQIQDVENALKFITQPKYNVHNEYFLIGSSAGAHLALLYGYKYDTQHNVKGICNTVGPTDFTDSSYESYPLSQLLIQNFVGPYTLKQKPILYQETSPIYFITASSPKTISFYGNQDPLIPLSQLTKLDQELTTAGVYYESTIYNGGHGDWSQSDYTDYSLKLVQFILDNF